jgi:hypothetical protein
MEIEKTAKILGNGDKDTPFMSRNNQSTPVKGSVASG